MKILGNFADLAIETVKSRDYPLSFLSDEWSDRRVWQAAGKGKVHELLAYNPKPCAMNAAIDKAFEFDGLLYELVSYDQPFGPRTQGYFIRPANASGKLPGIVALHDHGGFKYFGKEKIVALPDEHPILKDFKDYYYGGESWASRLAKLGFAVFAPDVFLWGSRKMTTDEIPERFAKKLEGIEAESAEYIEAYNALSSEYETYVAKSLFLAGTTWPGVMAYEDRRAVDYLASRTEVDAENIGCGGLSGGGLRTIFLAGLDERVKCAVCAGFMSTNEECVIHNIASHTWMLHLPHLSRFMDMPDIISLRNGLPLMVQYDIEDSIWTHKGQLDASAKLEKIYGKMGLSGNYSGNFYPGPHKFDVPMQDDAFAWYSNWLKQDS